VSIYPALFSSHLEVLEGFLIILRVSKARHHEKNIFESNLRRKASVNSDYNALNANQNNVKLNV